MSELTLWDSIGILFILSIIFSIAGGLDGIAQALVTVVAVVIVLLWLGNFFPRGYVAGNRADSIRDEPECETEV